MKIKPQYCLNGEYFYCDDKQIDITNRAFRFGDAIFESIFITSKVAPLLDKHFARLQQAVKYWQMELPKEFTQRRLAKQIERLCNKNRLFQGARARLTVFRSGKGLYTPESNLASYLLEVDYFPVQEFVLNEDGWKIDVYTDEIKYPAKAGRYKTAQSILSVKGSIYKQNNNLDEVLFLSPNQDVVEATAYNIFALKGSILLTPDLTSGCVAGIMRDTVISEVGELGLRVEEVSFPLDILEEAEEVFLTNAVVGIRRVLAFREKRYMSIQTKKIVALLNEKLIS
ncbi:branched-chain amino acid aminotransferase [Balneicella halophila]|uniref:branched-chain-amino-acid transaminase n=1 Tax=Balneicella halophila TaxID=1537566 RepID=A0A7L4UNU5_BALHA|nr:aminotransferase class IV [Balneicella halophila]PVX50781.1 branched-chain amino acid aminotransferase [Balneicella halophila]